ncbi:MAG: enoyl-ACP reductase [Pseudomonadota bacterium]
MQDFLQGKTIFIAGIASTRSIAYGVAEILNQCGARLILSYPSDKLEKRLNEYAQLWNNSVVLKLDVNDDSQLQNLASHLKQLNINTLDGIVHSIAFAPAESLASDDISLTSRQDFQSTLETSCFSLNALVLALRSILISGSSIVSMTYEGSQKVVPHYNVMGVAKAALESNIRYLASALGRDQIRVNAISAGPIKTLAAAGVPGFRKMLHHAESHAPLHRLTQTREVGQATAFLLSDWASAITGEIIHVDCGLHMISGIEIDSNQQVKNINKKPLT